MAISWIELAAVAAAALIAVVVAFQIALAAGLPLGAATMGGSAPTIDGVLTLPFRALALVQAVLLIGIAWVILARADVVDSGIFGERFWSGPPGESLPFSF
jgi:hypothetical protein